MQDQLSEMEQLSDNLTHSLPKSNEQSVSLSFFLLSLCLFVFVLFLCFFPLWFFETGFFWVALDVLELAM